MPPRGRPHSLNVAFVQWEFAFVVQPGRLGQSRMHSVPSLCEALP
jgi:hypothetical protein